MSLQTLVCLLFTWTIISALFVFLPTFIDIEQYADEETGLIWVSKRQTISWFFTHFFPYLAIPYDCLCETLNGQGLIRVMILIYVLTLPLSLILTIIGGIVLIIKLMWHNFTIKYAREES